MSTAETFLLLVVETELVELIIVGFILTVFQKCKQSSPWIYEGKYTPTLPGDVQFRAGYRLSREALWHNTELVHEMKTIYDESNALIHVSL